ncbi:hypothetical protein QT970_31820 [Microcoleus sp. herbarium8]|uniref:hypothetical protein n=1 Tax=Microcoleus sp. herbarium8 TaxID=3055436 RepID=UPI002FD2FA64
MLHALLASWATGGSALCPAAVELVDYSAVGAARILQESQVGCSLVAIELPLLNSTED